MNKLAFYGYHGAYCEENRLGQRFYVDLVMLLDLRQAGTSDQLQHTVDYGKVYQLVKDIVEGKPRKLVETVAEDIAAVILESYPLVEKVNVTVVKPDPPIPGHYDSVAVEITRDRS